MSTEENQDEYPEKPTHPMPGDGDTDDDDDDVNETKQEPILNNNNNNKNNSSFKCKSLETRTCSILAHNKMILHSLKHLTRPVFGVLIGLTYRDNNETYIHVMDAIPLQHNFFSSMIIEVAFMQIDEYLNSICKENKQISRKNLRILGVYYANSNCDDVSKNTSAVIIGSQLIKEYSRQSILMCQIISDRIEQAYKGIDDALDWYMVRNNGDTENKKDWKDIDNCYLVKNNINRNNYNKWLINLKDLKLLDVKKNKLNDLNLKKILKNKLEEKIYDFEDHLDDQSKDWRNIHLFNQL